jgi:hypothetical protein
MTNRPSIFAYLVFGPGGITVEGITRPIKTAARHGSGVVLAYKQRLEEFKLD